MTVASDQDRPVNATGDHKESGLGELSVAPIPFDEIKAYWIAVDHFGVPDKKIREVVSSLGPLKSSFADPRRVSYGLFDSDRIIGVTHLVQWSDDWVRYRTINIHPAYRGRDLGWYLIRIAVNMDWRDMKAPGKFLFGWIRRPHHPWSVAHGFEPADGTWHDDHMVMLKPMTRV